MRPSAVGPARTVTAPPAGVYFTALSTRLMRTAPAGRVGLHVDHLAHSVVSGPRRRAPWPRPVQHGVDDRPQRRRRQPERDLAQLEFERFGEIVEQPAQSLRVAEGDFHEAPCVLALLDERAPPAGSPGSLDGGQRRAQLVRDVGDELGAHVLQPPQLGDASITSTRPGSSRQRSGTAVTQQRAVHGVDQPELVPEDAAGGAAERRSRAGRRCGSPEATACLAAGGPHAEHRAGPLVHEQEALLAVDGTRPPPPCRPDGGGLARSASRLWIC